VNWRRMQFSWINEWEELVDARGHCHGVEFVLPEWFYRGVLDHSLVLTIDPAYFALTGGIERWLYRIARRHAGHQPKGWTFELRHLHAKSGSTARFSDFALDLRRIAARQSLPGYDLFIQLQKARELLRVVPRRLSTGIVDNCVEPIRRSGARIIRRSGARLSADQAHGPQLTGLQRETAPVTILTQENLTLLLLAPERPVFAAIVPPYRDRGGGIDRRHAQSKRS
jgi:plasmid replication initiation protein